jgi:protein-L-isoaspartate(D-aspartate) O-methyltransferase
MDRETELAIVRRADDLIGIAPERSINNGQPSLHAGLIANARLRNGNHVVHVGAGVGYYTAIMAHLVGPAGRVTGIESEADLAARASKMPLGKRAGGMVASQE